VKKISKIGQHLAKIWTKVCGLVFLAHPVYLTGSSLPENDIFQQKYVNVDQQRRSGSDSWLDAAKLPKQAVAKACAK